jgi:hypothetical protein
VNPRRENTIAVMLVRKCGLEEDLLRLRGCLESSLEGLTFLSRYMILSAGSRLLDVLKNGGAQAVSNRPDG